MTGHQGGAVAQALQGARFHLRGLTRTPDSPRAAALAQREEAQGKRLATLARDAGVEHFVYTSVGSAHKRTGIPHFDSKWRMGWPIAFAQTPIEPVRQYSNDTALMLEWFERAGYSADIAGLESESAARSRSCPTGHGAVAAEERAEVAFEPEPLRRGYGLNRSREVCGYSAVLINKAHFKPGAGRDGLDASR